MDAVAAACRHANRLPVLMGLLMRRKALPEVGKGLLFCSWVRPVTGRGWLYLALYVEACCVLLPLPAVFR